MFANFKRLMPTTELTAMEQSNLLKSKSLMLMRCLHKKRRLHQPRRNLELMAINNSRLPYLRHRNSCKNTRKQKQSQTANFPNKWISEMWMAMISPVTTETRSTVVPATLFLSLK
jgi:hypothetical protein